MTIKEIAELAGVSRTTVSRYLNEGYVSEEKRARIRKVIEETGYQPARHAQMLRTRQTKMIAVILPKINSDSISRMVSGISSVLSRAGYELLLANTNNSEQDELKYLRFFAGSGSVDGVILIGTILTEEHLEQVGRFEMPIVVLGQKTGVSACVYYDDYEAAHAMAVHMAETGKRIGYIGVTERDEAVGHRRKQGFLDALAEAGLHADVRLMEESKFSMQSGYDAAKRLFTRAGAERPDSLFCVTDNIAIGAMLYLREQGIRIPEEVQICGIGDSEKAHIVQPGLATVHYYYRTSGKETARILLRILGGGRRTSRAIRMGYKIVPGGSMRGMHETVQIPNETE